VSPLLLVFGKTQSTGDTPFFIPSKIHTINFTPPSPYIEVRLIALEALDSIPLNPDQMDRFISILKTGLCSYSVAKKILIYLRKSFWAKGQIGISFIEKTKILCLLSKYHITDPKETETLLLSFMDVEKLRQVVLTIQVLATELAHNHKIDSSIASKLIQGCRNLIADHRGYRIAAISKLVERLGVEKKREVVDLLVEAIKGADHDYSYLTLLQGLYDCKVNSVNVSDDLRKTVLTLLGHRNWQVADLAFEVALKWGIV
jgi:hypothetical protein